jgi:hypothetical protein
VFAIAITGDVVTNSRARVLQAGFDELAAKPFDLECFSTLVARAASEDRCQV